MSGVLSSAITKILLRYRAEAELQSKILLGYFNFDTN